MTKKNVFWSALFVLLLIGLSATSCASTGGGAQAEEKVLTVQGMPMDVYSLIDNNSYINVFPAGTESNRGVAAAHMQNRDIVLEGQGPFTLSIPLYRWGTSMYWSGSGTYDIFITLRNAAFIYKAESVDISSTVTSLRFSDFTKIK